MIIRPETEADHQVITDITIAAFKDHPVSQNTEQFIIVALRKANALAVSLVAEDGGEIVGHIAFSPVTFTDGTQGWYGLGPVSVVPERQRQGIGKRLVNEGLEILKDLDAKGCALVGDPNYYNRFGFKSPDRLAYEGVPQEYFMVITFGDAGIPTGYVKFDKAFGATE